MQQQPMNPETTQTRPEFVLTMGLPAAGKSTVSGQMMPLHTVIDCDAVKATHPAYDPTNPQALHEWSQMETASIVADAISSGLGQWIYDSTGTNVARMSAIIEAATEAGFSTKVVFVSCSLQTSLLRNSRRPRNVPEWVIEQKAEQVKAAWEQMKTIAHSAVEVQNDSDVKSMREW
jgi:predicted kinase